MPVVKNFDFDKAPAPPSAPAPIERVTMMESRSTAFDNPNVELEPLHGGVGLYVWLFVFAGLLLRLMLAALGPGTDPNLVVTPAVEAQQVLAETMIDHRAFGRPLTDADVVTPTLATPYTLEEATRNVEQLRRLRGETGGVFVDGIKPESETLPGVPALLAALVLAGLPLNVLVLTQCVLGGLLAWPAFVAVGGVVKTRAPAMLAAVLVALHPAMVTASLTLDGTIWVAIGVTLGLLSLTAVANNSYFRAAGGGFAIGLATLIQPWAFFAAPAIALWRVLHRRRLAGAGLAVFFLLVAAAPPAAWVYRNHVVDAGYVLTTAGPVDRAFGVPAGIMVADPGHEFRHDRPGAIAALWGDFIEHVKEGKDDGVTTPQALRSFAVAQLFDDPLAAGRYALNRARTLSLDHSAEVLLPGMGLGYEPSGYLAGLIGESTTSAEPDPVARWITEVWIGINLVLAAATVMGLVVSLVRRNWAIVVLVLGSSAMVLVFAPSWAGEVARLPLLAIQAVAITSLWMAPAPRRVKPPKQKAGDFDAAVPDAGFTIGPRDRVTAAAPPLPGVAAAAATPLTGPGSVRPTEPDEPDDEPVLGRPI